MLNIIWLFLLFGGILLALFNGKSAEVTTALTTSATQAIELAIALVGIMSFWLGLMRVAQKAGLVDALARLVRPIMRPLFPDIPEDHPAMGAIIMNLTANFIGLGNAATPFGLRAMEQLKTLSPIPKVASNAMCTFLALNTSSIQLIPITAMAILAATGEKDPSVIIIPTIIATTCSTVAAIIAVKCLQNTRLFKMPTEKDNPCT